MLILLIILLTVIIIALRLTLSGIKVGRLAIKVNKRIAKGLKKGVKKEKSRSGVAGLLKTTAKVGKKAVGITVNVATRSAELVLRLLIITLNAIRNLLVSLASLILILDVVVCFTVVIACSFYIMFLSDGEYTPTKAPQTVVESSSDSTDTEISREDLINEIIEYCVYMDETARKDNKAGKQWYYNTGNATIDLKGDEYKIGPVRDTFEEALKNKEGRWVNCATIACYIIRHFDFNNGASGGFYFRNAEIVAEKEFKEEFLKYFEYVKIGETGSEAISDGKLQPGDIVGYSNMTHTNFYAGKGEGHYAWYDMGHAYATPSMGNGAKIHKFGADTNPGTSSKVGAVLRLKDQKYYKKADGTITLTPTKSSGGTDSIDLSVIKGSEAEMCKKVMEEVIGNWGPEVTPERKQIVQKAISCLGVTTDYSQNLHDNEAGKIPTVTDCSGFVSWVFNEVFGEGLNANTGGLKDGYVKAIDASKKIPGDVQFKVSASGTSGNDDHVIIYLGKRNDGSEVHIHCTRKKYSTYIGGHDPGVRLDCVNWCPYVYRWKSL